MLVAALAPVVMVPAVLVAALVPVVVTVSPASAAIDPGTTVVALQDGSVIALRKDGTETELASGLGQVQSLAVLADGTMLTTDFSGNRLMGFGGRFGEEPVQVAAVDAPTGVTVGSDGAVYLTSLDGVLYRVDVDGRVVVPFASGLIAPGIPAEQGGVVYAPQGGFGVAAVSVADGSVDVVDAPVGQPAAAAAGASTPVLLSDGPGNKVVKYDPLTKVSDVFIEMTSPGPIAVDPTPSKGQAWSLLVGTPNAVVRIDAKGAVQERIEVTRPGPITGVGQTTVSIETTEESVATSTSVVKQAGDSGGGDDSPLTLLLAVVIAVGLVAGVVVLVKRSARRESDADWFKNPPAPPDPPPGAEGEAKEALSPEATQLAEVRIELAELTQAAAKTARQASTLREIASRALEARTNARIDREKEALRTPSVEVAPLTSELIELHSDEARAALDARQAGRLDDAGLRQRWTELGEQDALEQVFRFHEDRDRADLSAPSPIERQASRQALEARRELAVVETEQARVTTEINRLRGLEAELNRRVQSGDHRSGGVSGPDPSDSGPPGPHEV